MGSFLKLDWLDPYQLLASKLKISRHAMTVAFDQAFDAYRRCHSILQEEVWHSLSDPHDSLSNHGKRNDMAPPYYDKRARYYEAQVQDNLADWQASIVILFANDALQCFARTLLSDHRSLDGYGPEYPDASNSGRPVQLTTLLRASTNTIRHVSEWDTTEFPFPYSTVGEAKDRWRQALQNIDVITRVFGLGKHERIRDVVSMRALIRIDGTLGTPETTPSYLRFEGALIHAARDIARRAGGEAPKTLESHLSKSGYSDIALDIPGRNKGGGAN